MDFTNLYTITRSCRSIALNEINVKIFIILQVLKLLEDQSFASLTNSSFQGENKDFLKAKLELEN